MQSRGKEKLDILRIADGELYVAERSLEVALLETRAEIEAMKLEVL
jgi:hypothetical protein